ncbi:MAG: HtrA2 peptidase [Rhodopseudomonas palustris]|uniref:HtrA2 peptidase n=1 Tax=Rhodopseudomonas palustris TaxID=1076 RepID=A0A933VZG2_RHOPL|nr:HtrA2 peptidase [Rhodopseudomonas palustris]
MTRSPGPEAGFVQRSTPYGSLRLIRAVAASLVVAVVLLSVILTLAVASTQTSMAMPFAN